MSNSILNDDKNKNKNGDKSLQDKIQDSLLEKAVERAADQAIDKVKDALFGDDDEKNPQAGASSGSGALSSSDDASMKKFKRIAIGIGAVVGVFVVMSIISKLIWLLFVGGIFAAVGAYGWYVVKPKMLAAAEERKQQAMLREAEEKKRLAVEQKQKSLEDDLARLKKNI